MALNFTPKEIKLESGIKVISGPRTTRATVATDFPVAEMGTLYVSTVGKMNLKETDTGGAVSTDWLRVSTAASD